MTILSSEISAYLAKSAVEASVKLNSKAIVADSTNGKTIRNIAGYRGSKPVFALCYDQRTMRELSLSYGVTANYLEPRQSTDDFTRAALGALLQTDHINTRDLITVIAGNFGRSTGASYLEIATVQNLLDRY
jgi:pyruvate kinase